MSAWKLPPIIKVYEALGALADGRIHISGNTAKVFSSSGNKYYDVVYDPARNAITANDNGSYWQGYIGYPSIALLCALGVIAYTSDVAELLKGIPWKDVNHMFKDFGKAEQHVRALLAKYPHYNETVFDAELQNIAGQLAKLRLQKLPRTSRPPQGY